MKICGSKITGKHFTRRVKDQDFSQIQYYSSCLTNLICLRFVSISLQIDFIKSPFLSKKILFKWQFIYLRQTPDKTAPKGRGWLNCSGLCLLCISGDASIGPCPNKRMRLNKRIKRHSSTFYKVINKLILILNGLPGVEFIKIIPNRSYRGGPGR